MNKKMIFTIIFISIIGIFSYFIIYSKNNQKENNNMKINIKIENTTLTATLLDNSSSKELYKKLKKQDLTISMDDYGNVARIGPLNFTLPTNNEPITTEPGDIILYEEDKLAIYYDVNSWNFTKLGKIDNFDKNILKDIKDDKNIKVTLSIRK